MFPVPIESMYGVYLPTFSLICMVNVGKYTIHGSLTQPMDPEIKSLNM